MKRAIIKSAVLICVAVLGCAALFGCSAQEATTTLTDAQQENRAYMQKVNMCMEGFETQYANMADALASGNLEEAKRIVDETSTTLESLKALEVPEGLSDIQAAYVAGAEKLVAVVNDYYALYSENADAKSEEYQAKIADIQNRYNEGIEQLKAGDAAASSKE